MKNSDAFEDTPHIKVFVRTPFATAAFEYLQSALGRNFQRDDSTIHWLRDQLEETEVDFVELFRLVLPDSQAPTLNGATVKGPRSNS